MGTTQPATATAYEALVRAFRAINHQTEFSPMANAMLREAAALFQARAATLCLASKRTGELEIAAVMDVPEEALAAYMQHPVRVAAVEAEAWPEVMAMPESLGCLAKAGYSHAFLFPVRIQEKLIGLFTLASDVPFPADREWLDRMRLFGEFAAQAIENAYLIFQLRQQNNHLEFMMTKLQNAQNHLRRSEKMALIGKLAAAVAHEIRNPLTIVGTSLQWKFEKMEAADPERALIDSMISKVRSMDSIIKELMVFAKPLPINLKPCGLAETMSRISRFMEKKIGEKRITLNVEIPKDLPLVLADEEQTQRVFINLLINALQLVPEGGAVDVRAWPEPGQPKVWVAFTDHGSNIPPEHLDRIFEPFFTNSENAGLGLFLIKHILEEMNATIDVKRHAPSGMEFLLQFPQAR